MKLSEHDEDVEPPADAWPSRARQWSRAALALAVVFGSLPLTTRLIIGNWGFDDAPGIACLFLIAAAYLYLAGRVPQPPIPDSATILAKGIRVAGSGKPTERLRY